MKSTIRILNDGLNNKYFNIFATYGNVHPLSKVKPTIGSREVSNRCFDNSVVLKQTALIIPAGEVYKVIFHTLLLVFELNAFEFWWYFLQNVWFLLEKRSEKAKIIGENK